MRGSWVEPMWSDLRDYDGVILCPILWLSQSWTRKQRTEVGVLVSSLLLLDSEQVPLFLFEAQCPYL